MAKYRITSPEGEKFEIVVPDNASPDEVMAYARRQFANRETPSDAGVLMSGLNRGAAAMLDSFADVGPNVMNLAKVAVGAPLYALGRGDIADKIGATEMLEPVSPARRAMQAVGAGNVKPVTGFQKRLDYAAQAIPSAVFSPATTAGGLLKQAGLAAVSGLATGETQDRTGSSLAALTAGMLAPMGVQAVVSGARATGAIRQPFTAKGRELAVGDFLRGNVREDINPEAALAQKKPLVPGSKPTTAQLIAEAGDKRLLGYEKQLAEDTATRQAFDERYAANAAARAEQARRIAPGDDGAAVVQQRVRDEVAARQAAADNLRQNAAGSRDWAMGQTGRDVTDLQAGQTMANVYDDLDRQARQENSLNYDIDPFNSVTNIPLPVQQIGGIMDDVYAGVTKAAPANVREALGIVGQIAQPAEAAVAARQAKPKPVNYGAGEVNPDTDDLLAAIAKHGGLSRDQARQFGIDPAEFNKRAGQGKPVFPASGGKPFDRMAEELSQYGYPVAEQGGYSPYALANALDEAMRGRKILTPQGYEYQSALDDWTANRGQMFGEDLRPLISSDLTMSYKQMKVASGRIGELERQAMKSGDSQSAMALGRIKGTLRQAMDDAVEQGQVTPDIADAYRHATQQYAQYASRMKEGVAGNLRFRQSERNIKLETVPKAFLQSGEEAFRSFRRSIGGDETAAATAQDWLSTQWRNSVKTADGKMKSNWKEASAKWMKDNAEVLDVYPGLRQRVEYAIAKASTAEGLAGRLDNEMKRLGSGTAARHFLRELDPANSFASFMRSPNRNQESQLMVALAKRDHEFKAGVSAALREYVQGMKDGKFIEFMASSRNQQLINDLFGDRMMKQWRKIADDAKRDQLRTTTTRVAGSNTKANLAAAKAMEAISGFIPGAGVLRAVAGRVVDRMSGGVNDLKVKAFLDPQEALRLMQRSSATPDYVQSLAAELRRIGMTAPEAEKRAVLIQAIQQQNEERK